MIRATTGRPSGRACRCALAAAIAIAGLALGAPASAADMAWKNLRIGMRSSDSPQIAAAIGFETDLARDLCLRMDAVCEIASGKGDDSVAALQARRVDALMTWLPVTAAGRQAIDFSAAYAVERHGFLVASPGPLADLPGTGRALSLSVTPQDAKDAIAELGRRFRGKALGALAGSGDLAFLEEEFGTAADIRAYAGAAPMLADLGAGRLDAVMGPFTLLRAARVPPASGSLALSGPEFGEDERFGAGIAVGLRPSDTALRDMFDRAISMAMSDGTLERLSVKWFGIDISPHRCNCKPF
jgi:octopine/nopaline transport system substrate-binding protein